MKRQVIGGLEQFRRHLSVSQTTPFKVELDSTHSAGVLSAHY